MHLIAIFEHPKKQRIRVWQNSVAGYDYTLEYCGYTKRETRSKRSYDYIKESILLEGYTSVALS